eukprot:scaffold417_cov252-Pinguiococcus_pyrenoidosus.AAC.11
MARSMALNQAAGLQGMLKSGHQVCCPATQIQMRASFRAPQKCLRPKGSDSRLAGVVSNSITRAWTKRWPRTSTR